MAESFPLAGDNLSNEPDVSVASRAGSIDDASDAAGMQSPADRLGAETDAVLAAIIQTSDDAIISKTLDGVVCTWNEGAERIFGYTAAEMIGKTIAVIVPPDRSEEEPDILRRLSRGERVDHFETVRLRKDGQLITVSVTISPVRDRTGRITGASKIARDITLQKRYERELREAKDHAELASRAKDQFLAVLSHELRTPLTPVLAAVTHLQSKPDLPSDVREDIDTVRRNIEVEARLIDDLLDLTRIVRNQVHLHFEAVDGHESLRAAVAICQAGVDAKAIVLSIDRGAREHHIWADAPRIQQVMLNVLQNAVKFTPLAGRIAIETSNVDGRWRVTITDSGPGIDALLLPRIFDAFEQGEHKVARQFGGLGLGLAISRSLVHMHGGSITAASNGAGKGAVFVIEFATIDVLTTQKSEPAVPSTGTGDRILLVEDHPDTLRVLSKLLKSLGYRVRAVGSVKAALAAAETEPFELLISDIGLPDGSGTEIARELRARHPLRAIALSGLGLDDDIRRSHDAGFARHLVKPVNVQLLQETIQQVLSDQPVN